MTPNEFDHLRIFVRRRCGIDLTPDKRYLADGRLLPLARELGFDTVSALLKLIGAGSDGQSRAIETRIIEAIATHETYFFRDRTPFDHLRAILPQLMRLRASRKRLRIWSAAASTGQEPYSIAMLLKEQEIALAGWQIDIIATDLSNAALDKARTGVFSQFEVQRGLPIGLLLQHFRRSDEKWQISDDIRAMVHFQQANLIEDCGHLGEFDVVLCRNVLIYFDQPTRRDVVRRLTGALSPGGILVLGATETTIGVSDTLQSRHGQRGIYERRAAHAASPPGIVVPMARIWQH